MGINTSKLIIYWLIISAVISNTNAQWKLLKSPVNVMSI